MARKIRKLSHNKGRKWRPFYGVIKVAKQPPVNESYTNISNFSFFSRAQRQLDTMISKLESIGIQEHGVTEEYIRDSGAELLRLLLGHLDKLAHDESRFASVSTVDSFPRNHVRQGTTRTLVSLFPLDAQLNLHVDQYSDGVRRRIVGDVIDRSYDQAIEHHKENCSGLIGKRQAIKRNCSKFGGKFRGSTSTAQ